MKKTCFLRTFILAAFLFILTAQKTQLLFGLEKEQQNIDTAVGLQKIFLKIAKKYESLEVTVASRMEYYDKNIANLGSGVIISTDGYVLTNYHVVGNNTKYITVHVYGDKKRDYEASLVGKDISTDVAVIKLVTNDRFEKVDFGNSDEVEVGDLVLAIGSPFGTRQTVSAGIISAKPLPWNVANRAYEELFQTDAAMYAGNSGGPLVNIKGECIGINTSIAERRNASGTGFAVPINSIKDTVDKLIKEGEILYGWIGVDVKEVDEAIVKQFSLKQNTGVLVNRIINKASEELKGLKRGDVILKIDEKEIADPADFYRVIRGVKPGKNVGFSISRNGVIMSFSLKISDDTKIFLKKPLAKNLSTIKWESIEVSNLTPGIAGIYGISANEPGVAVVELEFNKGEIDFGIIRGDLIKSINNIEISNVSDFKNAVKNVVISEGVVFDIIRYGAPFYITYYK